MSREKIESWMGKISATVAVIALIYGLSSPGEAGQEARDFVQNLGNLVIGMATYVTGTTKP